jgi:hypothetical protein
MIGAMIDGPVLSEDEPDALSLLIMEKERLYNLIQMVKDRIAAVKLEYPYSMKSLVQSSEKLESRKAELSKTIQQLNETLAAYTAKIEEMLR